MRDISRYLSSNTTLNKIDISGYTGLELIGVVGLSDMIQLQESSELNTLFLNCQNIRDNGCMLLSKWLLSRYIFKYNSKINELYLRENGITTRGLMFLLDVIPRLCDKSSKKVYIDLSDNLIDEIGINSIEDMKKCLDNIIFRM